jgi:hypothetical protein
MAMKPKGTQLEVAPEHPSEQQSRKAAKAALKKADRFWRLAEKAPSENYREHHMKQAKGASPYRLKKKTRQANEKRRMKSGIRNGRFGGAVRRND